MPAITAPAKVLVSGANGFIAVWVVQDLLKRGYSVRGTVRSESKATHIRNLFASYGDKFEVVVVADITQVRFVYFFLSLLYLKLVNFSMCSVFIDW